MLFRSLDGLDHEAAIRFECEVLDVDLHSNLRLGSIWVKSGTEIETDASFSLNLSANFVALSGESGLLFDCGLPGFDDGV